MNDVTATMVECQACLLAFNEQWMRMTLTKGRVAIYLLAVLNQRATDGCRFDT